ncbi:MAG: glycosyltransferase family 2 protein [Chloroflexi bacterium]|nr:glycosyltransferase family 2 protein [Chloroflexota bacterium]
MPTVSIIVPCYNERTTIRLLLDAVYAQSYPRADLEVIIADGLSGDGTRDEIAAFQREHPDLSLQVIDNPARIIPAGLNRAIETARGEIIVRLDAHSAPYPDYVAGCVAALQEGKGENVGGVWDIRPGGDGWLAQSIAVAAAHPLGVGDALYRHATQPALVDTVPFGAFRRSLVERVGMFDETLLSNEDYEFNARVRQSGGRIWLDPAIRSVYFARTSLPALARQYWRYGYWKWRMLRRYPKTLRWRQALPPLFVLGLLSTLFLSFFLSFFGYLLAVEVFIYALVLFLAALVIALHRRKFFLVVGLPLAIATMHLSWGSGLLWSLLSDVFGIRKNG